MYGLGVWKNQTCDIISLILSSLSHDEGLRWPRMAGYQAATVVSSLQESKDLHTTWCFGGLLRWHFMSRQINRCRIYAEYVQIYLVCWTRFTYCWLWKRFSKVPTCFGGAVEWVTGSWALAVDKLKVWWLRWQKWRRQLALCSSPDKVRVSQISNMICAGSLQVLNDVPFEIPLVLRFCQDSSRFPVYFSVLLTSRDFRLSSYKLQHLTQTRNWKLSLNVFTTFTTLPSDRPLLAWFLVLLGCKAGLSCVVSQYCCVVVWYTK